MRSKTLRTCSNSAWLTCLFGLALILHLRSAPDKSMANCMLYIYLPCGTVSSLKDENTRVHALDLNTTDYCQRFRRFSQLPFCDFQGLEFMLNRTHNCQFPRDRANVTLFHIFLNLSPRDLKLRLPHLFIQVKAFLLSQDLSKTRLIIWTSDANTNGLQKLVFFSTHQAYVSIKAFHLDRAIQGTPLASVLVGKSLNSLRRLVGQETTNEIVAHLILHHHGGLYLNMDREYSTLY